MTSQATKDSGNVPASEPEARPAVEQRDHPESIPDLISAAEMMRLLEEEADGDYEEDEEIGGTLRLPKVTRMPEGMTVVEHRIGRAVAQWVLQVRCECGRRWFELKAVETSTCPRCRSLVYVDIDKSTAPG
jgi:hypothetical protein